MYYVILFLIPFIIPVTWFRQMKYFAVTNTIASGLVGASEAFDMAENDQISMLSGRLNHFSHQFEARFSSFSTSTWPRWSFRWSTC